MGQMQLTLENAPTTACV